MGSCKVSSLGRARKLYDKRKRYICKNKRKRITMCLTKNGKSITPPFARVILASFYHIQFNRRFVADHINNIPTDNKLSNLQAITQQQNIIKDLPPHKNAKYRDLNKFFESFVKIICKSRLYVASL